MPRYSESRRTEIRTQTRRLLLQAAIEAFARDGYEKANINDISLAAGFAKGTVYNYFESKRALMEATIRETADTHVKYIATRVLLDDDAIRRLERFFDAGWSAVSEYLPQLRTLVHTLYGADQDLKQELWQVYQPMHRLIAEDIISFGIEQGVFRSVDVGFNASLIMNLYLGIASHANDEGRIWAGPSQVAGFVLAALRK